MHHYMILFLWMYMAFVCSEDKFNLNLQLSYTSGYYEDIVIDGKVLDDYTSKSSGKLILIEEIYQEILLIFSFNLIDGRPPTIEPLKIVSVADDGESSEIQTVVSTKYPQSKDADTVEGHIRISFTCSSKTKAVMKVEMTYNIEHKIEFYFVKHCLMGSFNGFQLTLGGSDTNVDVLINGEVQSQYSDQTNPIKLPNNINYFIAEKSAQFISDVRYGVFSNNTLLSVSLGDDDNEDSSEKSRQMLEIIYSSSAPTTTTLIALITLEIEVASTIKYVYFLKEYRPLPLSGLDIINDKTSDVENHFIVGDGAVSSSFKTESPTVQLLGDDSCFNYKIRNRRSTLRITSLDVTVTGNDQGNNGQESLFYHTYGDDKVINSNTTYHKGVCHVCVRNATLKIILSIAFDINTEPSTLSIAYYKLCKIGYYPIDITPGIYVPFKSDFYAVKGGITQPPYRISVHRMSVRYEEFVTHFYVTSEVDVKITKPKIEATSDQIGLEPSISVIGYNNDDFNNDIYTLTSSSKGALIFEVTYNCMKTDTYHVIISFTTIDDNSEITFSYNKMCRELNKNYIITSNIEAISQYLSNGQDNQFIDLNTNNNIILFNGIISRKFVAQSPEFTVPKYTYSYSIYIASAQEGLELTDRIHASSSNPKIVKLTLVDDNKSDLKLSSIPKKIDFQFKCFKGGSSLIEVELSMKAKRISQPPVKFSFYKICEDPKSYNWQFIKIILLIAIIIIIIILLMPYVFLFFPQLRPRVLFGKYTRIPDKDY